MRSLLESIFDVDKNTTDEHEIEKSLFNDYNSPFWKYVVPVIGTGDAPMYQSAWESMEKEIDINKDIIYLPDTCVQLNTEEQNPFVNKYTLICNVFRIGHSMAQGRHPEPVAGGGGFKEIRTNKVQIDGMCEKLSGFKFILNSEKSVPGRQVDISWASDLDYFDAEFEWLDNSGSVFSMNEVMSMPDLKNIKSNAQRISMYDCSFFDCDNNKKDLDKFFGTGKIEANGVVKTKSIRNIVAVVNNIRKYGALDPDQIIPVGKLSDLIDIRGFKDIEIISMRSNNVKMTFVRPDNKSEIERHARFIRINNMKKYKDWKIEDIVDLVKKCQTKDGWVLLFTPEQYG